MPVNGSTAQAPSEPDRAERTKHDDRLRRRWHRVSVSVKLQELFGLAETPRIGPSKTPITFPLLAPNGRPVQTTQDLKSFWERTYPEVRKEIARPLSADIRGRRIPGTLRRRIARNAARRPAGGGAKRRCSELKPHAEAQQSRVHDLNRLVVAGVSAGGHVVLLAEHRRRVEGVEEIEPSTPAAGCRT